MKALAIVCALVVAMLALAGCASAPKSSHTALAPMLRESISQAPIELRIEETAAFRYQTSAQQSAMMVGMMFGAIGGGAAVLATDARAKALGAELVRETGIIDPTPDLARRVMSVLEQKLGAVEGDSPIQLSVSTQGWGVSNRGVSFNTRLELVDTRTDTRIARARCRYLTPKDENPPDIERMLANEAAFVKSSLDQAADACVNYFELNVVP
jgi:hypothetical protein